jgi:hypothetical protein
MRIDIWGPGWTGGKIEYEPGIDTPLRRCPFCKRNDVAVTNTHTPHYNVECNACGAHGPVGSRCDELKKRSSKAVAKRLHCEAFHDAIRFWNGTTATKKDSDRG